MLRHDALLACCKSVFTEYDFPKKKMSNAGISFILDKIKNFYIKLNSKQYHHITTRVAEKSCCA